MRADPEKRLFLVRHPQTDWNQQRRYQGGSDRPLTQAGEQSVVEMADAFRPLSIDALVSSPRAHALHLANAIAHRSDCSSDLRVVSDWAEIDHGSWEGKTYDEVERTFGAGVSARFEHPMTYTGHGGETLAQHARRVTKAWREVMRMTGRALVVVTHATPIQLVLCQCLDMSPQSHWKFRIDNSTVTSLCVWSDNVVIEYVNRRGPP